MSGRNVWWHGDSRIRDRVGHVGADEKPRRPEEGPRRAHQCSRPGPQCGRARLRQTNLPPLLPQRGPPPPPPIPLLLHETAEDATISGYHIPAKSRVMINAWAIGRDESSWEDAEEFKPARFLRDGVPDFKGSNFEFIPFGSGRRSCPGMQLGLYALEMAVAHLLHCFTWELPDGMKPNDLDMSDVFGLTAPRAERLVAVPRPRLLCQL
ncbi:UNVERIFIED_CONTAM: cytochrome [Sesamum latifolium]|uniref:Cytochrome n=1 Tax=Sesamum latifolium TaxID=2727402 RepID=A0AAW2SGD6_9LAMI